MSLIWVGLVQNIAENTEIRPPQVKFSCSRNDLLLNITYLHSILININHITFTLHSISPTKNDTNM